MHVFGRHRSTVDVMQPFGPAVVFVHDCRSWLCNTVATACSAAEPPCERGDNRSKRSSVHMNIPADRQPGMTGQSEHSYLFLQMLSAPTWRRAGVRCRQSAFKSAEVVFTFFAV